MHIFRGKKIPDLLSAGNSNWQQLSDKPCSRGLGGKVWRVQIQSELERDEQDKVIMKEIYSCVIN